MLSSTLISKLTPYVDEIIGDDHCGYISYWSDIPYSSDTGEKREFNGVVHHLLIDFVKVYDSARRKVIYIIFIEFGTPMKLSGIIEMCSS
jgi:hypothetical protein